MSQQFGKRAWVAGDIVVCGECFKDSTEQTLHIHTLINGLLSFLYSLGCVFVSMILNEGSLFDIYKSAFHKALKYGIIAMNLCCL